MGDSDRGSMSRWQVLRERSDGGRGIACGWVFVVFVGLWKSFVPVCGRAPAEPPIGSQQVRRPQLFSPGVPGHWQLMVYGIALPRYEVSPPAIGVVVVRDVDGRTGCGGSVQHACSGSLACDYVGRGVRCK